MKEEGFFTHKKLPITITLLIIAIGSFIYFSLGSFGEGMLKATESSSIYNQVYFKSVYTPEGQIKVFALAKNNELAKYEAIEGDNIPESDTVIIGNNEAEMMKSEKLFSKAGDEINNFFGVDVKVGGILKKTNSPIDDFHFVSEKTFSSLKGDYNKMFVKVNKEGVPKVFYTYSLNQKNSLKFKLAEGSLEDYSEVHTIAGENYYSLLLGATEAKMMREESLFSQPGDMIKDLFGTNVIVIGIIEPTNTSLDMMHLTSLTDRDFAEVKNE